MVPRREYPLQQLYDLDRTLPEFHERLGDFLRSEEYRRILPSLQGEDLVQLVAYLNSVSL